MTGEQKPGGLSTTPDLAGLCERLRGLIAKATGDKPLPWTVWTSCSFRRIGCVSTDGDGDVLSAYAQRSDGHPDLSMPEDRLIALVEVINAIPEAAAAIERLAAENAAMRKATEGLSAAISWLDYPFVDNRTAEPELRSRVGFMMKDAEPYRIALKGAADDR